MIFDHASDMDHAAWVNRWSLDEQRDNWCERHQQRADSCGPCYDEALADAEHAWWHDSQPAADEELGAALAARFEGE